MQATTVTAAEVYAMLNINPEEHHAGAWLDCAARFDALVSSQSALGTLSAGPYTMRRWQDRADDCRARARRAELRGR